LAIKRLPHGAQPRSGGMLVLVQLSSMNTRREAWIRPLILDPLRSPARDVRTIAFASHHRFFEAQLLLVDEGPHRAVIHLQAACAELSNQASQGEILLFDTLQQPAAVLPGNDSRLVAADLTGPNAAGPAQPSHPPNRRAGVDPNCTAARRADKPPFSTAATTRSRRSRE
jgi:hypothetical protein